MTFTFFGFVQVDRQTAKIEEQAGKNKMQAAENQRIATKTIRALRKGCEGVNELRVNQALGLQEAIATATRSLKRPLGPLASFRRELVRSLEQRRRGLLRLRASVGRHAVAGRAAERYPGAERPYRVDCVRAYP